MMKLKKLRSLSEEKTISGRFSIGWTKSFEGIKKQHRKHDCLDCKIELMCDEYVVEQKMNLFELRNGENI